MNLLLSIEVVLPILVYILLGIFAKKMRWIGEKGLSEANKIIYYVFFPTIIFKTIYNSHLEESFNGKLILYFLIMFSLFFLLLYFVIPLFIKEKPVQGSVIQGIYRGNLILYAIPVLSTIFGDDNIGVASVCISLVTPFVNILCVILFEKKRGTKAKFGKLLLSILKNPIIIGALFGIFFKVLDIKLPTVFEKVVFDMSSAVTPFALVLLGAGLNIGKVREDRWLLLFVCISKLVIMPLVFVGFGYLLGFRGIALATIFALTSVPTAVSSHVMAEEMGGDGTLAGEIVCFTSLFSIITIFLWMLLLTGIGWV
ncbi:MAG: AEC family transporter [Bacilli bacterium]|nr:AEC family transporter [Bacilli bacterium]